MRAPIDEFYEGTAVNPTKTEVINTSKSSTIADLSFNGGQTVASPLSTELRTITSGPATFTTSTTPDTDNDISGDPPKSSKLSNNRQHNNSSPTLHTGMSEESSPAPGIGGGTFTTDGLSEPDMQQNGDQSATNEEDEMTIDDDDDTDVTVTKKQSASKCLKRKRGNESEDKYTDDDSDDENPPEDTKPVMEVPDEEDLADM